VDGILARVVVNMGTLECGTESSGSAPQRFLCTVLLARCADDAQGAALLLKVSQTAF
jgi:hypothetical protein